MILEARTLGAMRERVLGDTGAFARMVLGFDYDKDDRTGEKKRPGGIRMEGPHADMVRFLDAQTLYKHIEAPRGSYKTTALTAYAMRRVMKNPSTRVFYGMATYTEALKAIDAIRDQFEGNERLIDIFGEQKSDTWARERFTVKSRTDRGIREPSFSAFGLDKNITGGHCDVLILDDLVNWQSVRTAEGMQKVLDCFRMVLPLLDPGGTLIVCGTRYHDADLYGHILDTMRDQFDILILDCGMDLVRLEGGRISLAGEPKFAHLTKKFLEERLSAMGSTDFSSQYLNRCLSEGMAHFSRAQFRVQDYENWMSSFAWYLLTDTATSSTEDGCYSVLAVVGIDRVGTAYLADLQVGHWAPSDFTRRFFEVYLRWSQRFRFRGATFERVSLAKVFRASIADKARELGERINLIDVPRGFSDGSKDQRIRSLQPRFEGGQFIVLKTVPKYFQDVGRQKVLFDPEGFRENNTVLPDGELVLEFVRHPVYPKKDIADAIADIDATDSEGNRLCPGPTRHASDTIDERRRRAGEIVTIPLSINGMRTLVNATPITDNDRPDFWGEMRKRIPG